MDSNQWDERYRSADRLWSAGPNLFVEDRLAHAEPGQGLDLAAGEGRNAIWLASLGWEMTAVDFSAVAVKRGQVTGSGVKFEQGDVLTWEPSHTFDLILVAYLHLPHDEIEAAVRRSFGWLKPGGEYFMIGHDVSNLADGYGGPQDPGLLWDAELIHSWLPGTPIETQVVRRPVEVDDGMVYARDTLVRVRAH